MPAEPTATAHALPAASMGNLRTLTTIRYGNRSNGRKVYIQSGLHADEPPGLLVMHHLIQRLAEAHADGKIDGEIVLVPSANPIGISQWRDDMLQGRFDFYNSINFNRKHLDLTTQVADAVEAKLQKDARANIDLIRAAAGEVLTGMAPADEAEYLKHLLLSLAFDADIVLDLHCDYQSVMHVYLGTPLWPEAADLSAQMGAAATLLADDSGVTPFDEACSRMWWKLAEKYPDYPIPSACLAATVELRGSADVDHALATEDAANIFAFLQRRGFIRGEAPALPELKHAATPLAGVEHIKPTVPGVVVFHIAPGAYVEAGTLVAEVINPIAPDANQRVEPLYCTTAGMLFARSGDRYARPGRILAKVAGSKPLKEKGTDLLTP